MKTSSSCPDLPPPQLWEWVTALIVLCAAFQPVASKASAQRIFLNDFAHPVVAGEVWLIANRWGAYQGVLVATVRNGKVETRQAVQFPEYWEQAFDYKLLLAVADQPVGSPSSLVQDFAYGTVGRPEYLKHFSTICLSPPLTADKLGKDWPTTLQQMGHLSGSDLIMPAPARRTIRLLYPDGRPLGRAQVPISLYGSSENHCGVAVGIELGTFPTNDDGDVSVVAPDSALDLAVHYFEERAEGPAGEAFSLRQDVVIKGESRTTVKELWALPQHDYVVRLSTGKDQPIVHAHLTGCENFDGCGAGCGPISAPESDVWGIIRFRSEDLRGMRSITVVSAEGKERVLTNSEMHDLLTSYQANLRWD